MRESVSISYLIGRFIIITALFYQCTSPGSEFNSEQDSLVSKTVLWNVQSRIDSLYFANQHYDSMIESLQVQNLTNSKKLDSVTSLKNALEEELNTSQIILGHMRKKIFDLESSSQRNAGSQLDLDSLIRRNESLQEQLAQRQLPASEVSEMDSIFELESPEKTVIADSLSRDSLPTKPVLVESNVSGRGGVREAFRLYLLSIEASKSNPTIGLNLGKESLKHHPDKIIEESINRLYKDNRFYKILFKSSHGIKSASMYKNNLIAMVTADSVLIKYNLVDGTAEEVVTHSVTSVVFGNAGYYVGSFDGSIQFKSMDGTVSNRYDGHNDHILHLAYNDSTGQLISSGLDKKIRVWETNLGDSKNLVGHTGQIDDLDVHHPYILSTANDLEPRLWNMEGRLLLRFRKQPSRVTASAVNPYDYHLLTADDQGEYRVWSHDGDLIFKRKSNIGAIHSISNSAHNYTAFGGHDGAILLTDSLYAPLMELKGHADQITWLHFDKTGRYLFSASLDGTLRKWDIEPSDGLSDFDQFEKLDEAQKTKFAIRD